MFVLGLGVCKNLGRVCANKRSWKSCFRVRYWARRVEELRKIVRRSDKKKTPPLCLPWRRLQKGIDIKYLLAWCELISVTPPRHTTRIQIIYKSYQVPYTLAVVIHELLLQEENARKIYGSNPSNVCA